MNSILSAPSATESQALLYSLVHALQGYDILHPKTEPQFVDMIVVPGVGEWYIHRWLSNKGSMDTVVFQVEFDSTHITLVGKKLVMTNFAGDHTLPYMGQVTYFSDHNSAYIETGWLSLLNGLMKGHEFNGTSPAFGFVVTERDQRPQKIMDLFAGGFVPPRRRLATAA